MVRQAERGIDHQVRAQEQLDEKSQRGVTLAMAALGGGLAIGSFVSGQASQGPDGPFFAILATGGVTNILALVQLLDAYTGLRESAHAHVAPSARWLAEKAASTDWTWMDHQRAVLSPRLRRRA